MTLQEFQALAMSRCFGRVMTKDLATRVWYWAHWMAPDKFERETMEIRRWTKKKLTNAELKELTK